MAAAHRNLLPPHPAAAALPTRPRARASVDARDDGAARDAAQAGARPARAGHDPWGIRFSNPIGLAAGMDKDIRAVAGWQAMGFGFAELGTVTPLAQPGNPRPRLWRLPEHRALVNRLGFPSAGMESGGAPASTSAAARIENSARIEPGAQQGHAAGARGVGLRGAGRTAGRDGRLYRDQRELAEYAGAARLAVAGAPCAPDASDSRRGHQAHSAQARAGEAGARPQRAGAGLGVRGGLRGRRRRRGRVQYHDRAPGGRRADGARGRA